MSEHTPGPWRWETNHACSLQLKGAYVFAGPIEVAQVLSRSIGSQTECEANARLIAEAPNMATRIAALEAEVARLTEQIERLAQYIIAEVPGEPSQNEGAVDTAIRAWRRDREALAALAKFWRAVRTTRVRSVSEIWRKGVEAGLLEWQSSRTVPTRLGRRILESEARSERRG